ncbi:hypothetical protein BX598_2347 [Micrococcaceae bacterium JKS001869]|nr:hypothetical protein BX598_2347 [Micrococcaceae bacterium JKS001869]
MASREQGSTPASECVLEYRREEARPGAESEPRQCGRPTGLQRATDSCRMLVSMDRISWERHSGEAVEHAVAMFLAREFPTTATHIKPSQGDGGIDILVKLDCGHAVYQVKNFGSAGARDGSLSASRKRQITDSMDRLKTDPRVSGLDVRQWYLVAPMNPTLEALSWLQEEAATRSLPTPIWHGLSHCDAWAAKYPDVVDYYFQGSRETIRAKAIELLSLSPANTSELPLSGPADQLERLQRATEALSAQDLHYRYGLSTAPIPGDVEDVGAFVAAHLKAVSQHPVPAMAQAYVVGGWIRVLQVYPKTQLSLDLEPITVDALPRLSENEPAKEAWREFLLYGEPLNLPMGSVDIALAAPGGLQGNYSGVGMQVTPHPMADQSKLRCMVIDPDGTVIAELPMTQERLTFGTPNEDGRPRGVRTTFCDELGLVTVTASFINGSSAGTLAIGCSREMTGLVVSKALPAMRFLANAGSPNSLLLAPAYGPYEASTANPLPPLSGELSHFLNSTLELVNALNELQGLANEELHVPPEEEIRQVFDRVMTAAALLKGREAYIGGVSQLRGPSGAFEEADGQVRFRTNFRVEVSGVPIDLGEVTCSFHGSRADQPPTEEEAATETWAVADDAVRLRRSTSATSPHTP